MQRWNRAQMELLPELEAKIGTMTPAREKPTRILERVRTEEFTESPVTNPSCVRKNKTR
jgi:hypothetical protein